MKINRSEAQPQQTALPNEPQPTSAPLPLGPFPLGGIEFWRLVQITGWLQRYDTMQG